MERLSGVDALRRYSFREIALPVNQAIDVLTGNARQSFVGNLQILLDSPGPESAGRTTFMARIKQAQQHPEDSLPPGGISFSEDELRMLYGSVGARGFRHVVSATLGRIAPDLGSRNRGNVVVGYLMDLLNIVNPEVASYEDSLSEMLIALREGRMDMFYLGAMVDDAIRLKGTPRVPFDYFGDSQGATKLKDKLLPLLTAAETTEFVQGLTVTREQLMRDAGFN